MHKPIFAVTVLGIGGYMAYRLLNLKKFAGNAYFHATLGRTPDIVDLGLPHLAHLRMFINLEITNPQNTTFTATHPYMQILDPQKVQIAVSNPTQQTYQIVPGRTKIENIEVRIPLNKLLSAGDLDYSEIYATIFDTSLTLAQKTARIYEIVYARIQGKRFYITTTMAFDGVNTTDTQQFTF